MKKNNTWVIIPAHNERERIVEVIKKAKKYIKNIIVVDDGSNDNTYDIAKKNKIIVLKHIINLGKGAALKTGLDYALQKKGEIFVVLDADGQHDPDKIPLFLNNLKKSDIVLGYRKLDKNMPLVLKFGNWFINKTIKFLYGIEIKDTQCGYRAFTSYTYRKIKWKSSDYSMESEMIANVGKKGLKYKEVPIQTIYSEKYKGTTIVDGIKIILNLIWWRFFNSKS